MAETQWEYRVLTAGSTFTEAKNEDLELMLNEIGTDGWEVIAVYNQEGSNKIRIFAKRKLTGRPVRRPSWPGY